MIFVGSYVNVKRLLLPSIQSSGKNIIECRTTEVFFTSNEFQRNFDSNDLHAVPFFNIFLLVTGEAPTPRSCSKHRN